MLPLINALSTDPIDLTSATPSASAFGLDSVELQATFGDLVISSMPAAEPAVMTLADEALPPGGNSLPVSKPVVNVSLADDATMPADEQGNIGDLLAVTATDNEAQFDATDGSGSDAGLVVQGFLNPGKDLPDAWRIRDGMQQPLTPGNARIFDNQTTNANWERPVNHQPDVAVRVPMPERPVAVEVIDSAKQTIESAAATLRPLVEKFEVSPKSINISASQPTVIASESISQLQSASNISRVSAAPPAIQSAIDVPVLDDAWGDALNERVLWMAGKSIQRAEIRLNPADLGPIRVDVSVADDAAKVSFSAQNVMTREAIEAAMPRLREMLSENGLSLANTDVSDTGGQQAQNARDQEALHGPSAPTDAVVEDGVVSAESALKSGLTSALVDTFA